jgi:hypothetical protein
MQLNDSQTKLAAVLIIVVVIGLGYLLWTRSAPPEPVPLPGQTLQNPLGETPGTHAVGTPGRMPAPGTVDPKMGFGPSRNAPIPGNR